MPKQGRPTPAYRALAEQLREVIGRNGSGSQLPTEAELTRLHGLSRQTVRRAYQELVADGIVRRIPGRGTFSTAAGAYVRSLGSFDEMLEPSRDTELELISPLHVVSQPHEHAAERLGGAPVMEVRFRRLQEGLPYSFSVVSLPEPVGRLLARMRLLRTVGARRRTTVLELVDGVLESRIVNARQDISVGTAPPDVSALIDVRPQRPVLRIDRLYFDTEDRPVKLAVNYMNPERYTYRLELRRTLA